MPQDRYMKSAAGPSGLEEFVHNGFVYRVLPDGSGLAEAAKFLSPQSSYYAGLMQGDETAQAAIEADREFKRRKAMGAPLSPYGGDPFQSTEIPLRDAHGYPRGAVESPGEMGYRQYLDALDAVRGEVKPR